MQRQGDAPAARSLLGPRKPLSVPVSAKKYCSGPVALEPPGRCFPARCGAAWGGYGAAWAACRPRAAVRYRPHRQHGHVGLLQPRGTQQVFPVRLRLLAKRNPKPAPRFSRITKHETRNTAFLRITAFLPRRQTADARRRQARRLQGGMYEARENEWKGVFLNPETGITTYTESGFGSRFGIPHYSSVFVAKIRISPCRQSSAPAHCGNRNLDFMDVSSPSLTFAGPQVAPSGEAKGERGNESRNAGL